jgi:uncharacterized protein YukE
MARWDMGSNVLTQLTRNTSSSGEELSGLVKQLVRAAEPLTNRFNGAGKAAFDRFKANADQISADLGRGLGSINRGQAGMNKAFLTGDSTMGEEANRNMSAANFEAARFRG